MEDRVERLENLVALQDRTIEKLNDAIFEQQQQITDLHKLVGRLAGRVRDLDDALDQAGGHENTPPPHYNG